MSQSAGLAPAPRLRKDDGPFLTAPTAAYDLNCLLAREQVSIMRADAAGSDAEFEHHRDASLDARGLINATDYPVYDDHVFLPRVNEGLKAGENLAARVRMAEDNERRLTLEFADGRVSAKSFQHRSRCLRQDRDRRTIAPVQAS